jgi:Tfp pilus assembly protein PilF
MISPNARLSIVVFVLFCGSQLAWSQARNPGGTPSRSTGPSRTPVGPDPSLQPIFISGKVVVEGSGSPGEPVAIERVCQGNVRREGYTDFKGQFEIQLGANPTFQDASEGGGQPSTAAPRVTSNISSNRQLDLRGCEVRAAHPGFQSSSVIIRSREDSGYDVGTIVIKRMGDAKGSTVSLTSMAAPRDSKQAFEKAERAFSQKRYADAEKELEKALKSYPQFAAAWSLLGDLHLHQGQLQKAREEYQRAISSDPQYLNPVFGTARIAIQEKNWQEATQLTSQVLKLNGYAFPDAYFFNAACNYNLAQYEAAEESARKFKSIDSEHHRPEVSLLLSHILVHKKDFTGAAQQIRDYLALAPNDPGADKLKAQIQQLEEQSLASKN